MLRDNLRRNVLTKSKISLKKMREVQAESEEGQTKKIWLVNFVIKNSSLRNSEISIIIKYMAEDKQLTKII